MKAFKRNRTRQAGFSLIYVIFILTAISALAAGLTSFFGSGLSTQLNRNAIIQARYMAMAGLNYVKQFGDDYGDLQGQTFSFPAGQFTFVEVDDRNPQNTMAVKVQVVGTVNPGTSREANYVLEDTFLRESQRAISFREDFDDFEPYTSNAPVIVTDPVNKTFTVGNNVNFSFGAMYYTGNKVLNFGNNICEQGICDFKEGFRMFFVSRYTRSDADGIVFAWFSDENNTAPDGSGDLVYAIGGSSELGEMMGYAGDGRIYDGSNFTYGDGTIDSWIVPELISGIQAPKMGVEFDNYKNSDTHAVCSSGTFNKPQVGRRKDHGTFSDWRRAHIAYVLWGDDSPGDDLDCARYWKDVSTDPDQYYYNDGSEYATMAGMNTFDDNRHGDGDNAANDDTDGYWKTDFEWLNQPFAFRLEVQRNESTGEYELTAWLRQCNASPPAGQPDCYEYFVNDDALSNQDERNFADTGRFLCDGGTDFASGVCTHNNIPLLEKTYTLDAARHASFEDMVFGFTTATGGATQIATYSEFVIQFIKSNDYDGSGDKIRVIDRTIN